MKEVFITEIFKSFQGESTFMGRLTSFIRLSECNLRCSLCDTKYSWVKGHSINIKAFDKILDTLNTPYWCITGGEPLLQKEALKHIIDKAKSKNIITSVETNGSLQIIPKLDTKWIIDVKTPSMSTGDSFDLENLNLIQQKDELKFVISDMNDFNFAKSFISQSSLLDLGVNILFSPNLETNMKNKLPALLAKWGANIIFQPQLHKLIPEKPEYILERQVQKENQDA